MSIKYIGFNKYLSINLFHDLEREVELVDGNLVLPGMGLEDSCEEPLREVQPADPVAIGVPVRQPLLHKLHSVVQIPDPTCKWFQTRVRYCHPTFRNLVVHQRVVPLVF